MGPMSIREEAANRFGIAMPWKEAVVSPATAIEGKQGTAVSFATKPKTTHFGELLVIIAVVGIAGWYASQEIEKRVDP